MEPFEEYAKICIETIEKIKTKEERNILKAAEIITEAILKDKLIHVFGPGHGRMGVDEMFFRAGGLVPINPIYDEAFSLSHVLKTAKALLVQNYMSVVLDYYKVSEGDVMIILEYLGVNPVIIDAALESKHRGAKVIGITSSEFSKSIPLDSPLRHPTKKNLHEIADVFIDTYAPPGDAVLKIKDFKAKVAPISNISYTYIVNSIVAQVVKNFLEKGIEPPVWISINVPGGPEHDQKYIEKYFNRIKHL
jgi:uncharacterized phosphosugar-binding protein